MSPSASFRVDVTGNRASMKWSRLELFGRALWGVGGIIFSLTPRPAWGARRFILRVFGAEVASGVHIYPSVRITIPWNLKIGESAAIGEKVILYALGPISIGSRSVISPYAYICAGTHDYRIATMPLLKLPIVIGSDSWICAGAFVGPGVTVGDGAILGARSVAVKDVPSGMISCGNPARAVKTRPPTLSG